MTAASVAAAPGGRGRRAAEVGLVGVAAAWGLTFTLISDAVRALPPLTFVAYRFLLAGLLLAVPYAGAVRRLPPVGWLTGGALGLVLFAGYTTQTFGLVYTTASNAGFITGLCVVFTPVLGWLILRERVGPVGWLCALAATGGLALLTGGGSGWHPLGDALVLGCAVAFAGHILLTGWAVRRLPAGPLVAVQLLVCGVLAGSTAGATGDLQVPRGGQVWTALLFTAVVASAAAYAVQSYAQRRTSASRTALILATEPVFAGVCGYLLAGDRLTAVSWAGAALMIAAVLAGGALSGRSDGAPRERAIRKN